jgi:hypothetical protein
MKLLPPAPFYNNNNYYIYYYIYYYPPMTLVVDSSTISCSPTATSPGGSSCSSCLWLCGNSRPLYMCIATTEHST